MTDDPIVEEVHRIREQLLADYKGDLRALIKDARQRTEEARSAGHMVISPPARHPRASTKPATIAG